MIRKLNVFIANLRYQGYTNAIAIVGSMFLSITMLSIYIVGCTLSPWLLVLLPFWYIYIVSVIFGIKDGIFEESYTSNHYILKDYEEMRRYAKQLNKIIANQNRLLRSKTRTI
jgi:uncharacterized membrane protein (DUF106 family)